MESDPPAVKMSLRLVEKDREKQIRERAKKRENTPRATVTAILILPNLAAISAGFAKRGS